MAPVSASPHITEPMTMVTDYILATQVMVYAVLLVRKAGSVRYGWVGYWVAAFLATALAAYAGGTSHGFRMYLGEHWQTVWNLTVASIALSAALTIYSGVRTALRPYTEDREKREAGKRWLLVGAVVSAVGIILLTQRVSPHPHFNQNDLYHVIQMFGLHFLYRGAVLLHGL
jgi:hypothetical protein